MNREVYAQTMMKLNWKLTTDSWEILNGSKHISKQLKMSQDKFKNISNSMNIQQHQFLEFNENSSLKGNLQQ